jgi:hypothetical protein
MENSLGDICSEDELLRKLEDLLQELKCRIHTIQMLARYSSIGIRSQTDYMKDQFNLFDELVHQGKRILEEF